MDKYKITHVTRWMLITSLVFFYSVIALASENPHDTVQHEHHYNFSLKKGERLYYGLIKKDISCVACHNIHSTDTFNWNPSTAEISARYKSKSVSQLAKVLNNPTGKVLTNSHSNFNLNDEEVRLLKEFMDKFDTRAGSNERPVIDNLIIFIGLILLMLLSLFDLLVTHKIKFKLIHLAVILFALIYNANTLVHEAISLGRQQDYSPDQPIKFSHAIHAGENNIDCKYCHNTVDYSKSASIPSANVCLNCHTLIREGTNSGKWEINKIHEAVDNNVPIEWIKVHNLPDHVFFSHAQHVGVAKLDCNQCHGEVEQMTQVKQVSDLSMGWCINCHRETAVDFANNQFYEKYTELHKKYVNGEISEVTADMVGGLDCMKCHY